MRTIEQQVSDMLARAAKQISPSIDVSQGTAIFDLLIKPITFILTPLIRIIEGYHYRMSIRNAAILSDLDMDDLMANFFLFRKKGDKAGGDVRIYFGSPLEFNASPNQIRVVNANGIEFTNPFPVFITELQMRRNIESRSYYVDAYVEATSSGFFPTEAGTLNIIRSIPSSPIAVNNLSEFYSGSNRETNYEFAIRGEKALTVRNLINKRSIETILKENFSWVNKVKVIGYGDPEMKRDVINLAEIVNLLNGSEDLIQPVDVPNITDIERFHVGNKVDIYINQRNIKSGSAVLTSDETRFYDSSIYPGGGSNMALDLSKIYDENGNQRFNFPIYRITSVQILNSDGDPVTLTNEILEEPEATASNPNGFSTGMFSVSVGNQNTRYSVRESILLRLKNDLDASGNVIPNKTHLQGQPLKISYEYFEGVAEIQNFVKGDEDRVVGADLMVRGLFPAVVSYYDDRDINNKLFRMKVKPYPGKTIQEVQDAINAYIEEQENYIEISDIVAHMYENNFVSYMKQPTYLRIILESDDGKIIAFKPTDSPLSNDENGRVIDQVVSDDTYLSRFDLKKFGKSNVSFISEIICEEDKSF